MPIIVCIYKITNPNGKIYIGQSTNYRKRMNIYKKILCPNQPKLYYSLNKYGWDNHTHEIIEECSIDQLDEREIYWGVFYEVLGENGLNLALGRGRGFWSEETKQKRKLQKITPEHIKILSDARHNKYNPIFQYDMDGNFIKEWSQPRRAIEVLNINSGGLCTITDKINRTLGGFRFTSVFYDKIPPIKLWSDRKKCTLQYDLEGNFIKEWDSAKEAADFLEVNVRNITTCCRGKISRAYKFRWKYKKLR